jgi:hypothetical protein
MGENEHKIAQPETVLQKKKEILPCSFRSYRGSSLHDKIVGLVFWL